MEDVLHDVVGDTTHQLLEHLEAFLVKGYAAPYPAQYACAHGKGLARMHLALDDPDSDEDEE